jgi:multidrug efflux system membrane fusion protein
MPDTITERVPDFSGDADSTRRRGGTRTGLAVRFVIMAVLLAALIGGAIWFVGFREKMIAGFLAGAKPPPAPVTVALASSASVPQALPGIGTLAAVRQVTVAAEVGGRVVQIFFEGGGRVKAGDPLVQLYDKPELADIATFQAQAKLAQVSLGRSKELAGRNFGPQATVDQNQAQLEEANAGIAKTQAIIAQKLIRAPFDGDLGTRQVNLGQYLNQGGPVVTLTDLSTLWINFTVPEQNSGRLTVGQVVRVGLDAFPGESFEGKITTIEPQIGADMRAIKVQAVMANPDRRLLPGMFAKVDVVLPPVKDAVIVPETAVDYTLYGNAVFVLQPAEDGAKDANGNPVLKAVRTFVKTGDRFDNKVAILSGVKPGDRVVAAGQNKLVDGALVVASPTPPLAAPAKTPIN